MSDGLPAGDLGLRSWRDPAIVALALMAFASGFGQGGRWRHWATSPSTSATSCTGRPSPIRPGCRARCSGSAWPCLRLASLGALPLAGTGRPRRAASPCSSRPARSASSSPSWPRRVPGYWWFVVIFALGRPLLSTTNAVAQVSAAEETDIRNRAKAVALIAAGYGVGTGLTAVIDGLAKSTLGFRGLFLLAVVPLAAIVFIRRSARGVGPLRGGGRGAASIPCPVLGAVGRAYRWRLLIGGLARLRRGGGHGPGQQLRLRLRAERAQDVGRRRPRPWWPWRRSSASGDCSSGASWPIASGGDRPGAMAMTAMALTGILAYSGSRDALLVGYELGVLAAATLAPAAGALANELFPTVGPGVGGGVDRGRQRGAVPRSGSWPSVPSPMSATASPWVVRSPSSPSSSPPGSSSCSPRPRAASPRICGPTPRRPAPRMGARPRRATVGVMELDRRLAHDRGGARLPARPRGRRRALPHARHRPVRAQRREPTGVARHRRSATEHQGDAARPLSPRVVRVPGPERGRPRAVGARSPTATPSRRAIGGADAVAAGAAAGPGGFAEHLDDGARPHPRPGRPAQAGDGGPGLQTTTPSSAGRRSIPSPGACCWRRATKGWPGVMTTMVVRREAEVRAAFDVPDHMTVAALIALGRPVHQPSQARRAQSVEDFTTIDRFDGPALRGPG